MPLPAGTQYRTLPNGVRLAWSGAPGKSNVIEAKNTRTGAVHTPAEFRADREKQKQRAATRTRMAKHRGQINALRRLSSANG